MVSYMGQPDLWSQPPSPRQKLLLSPIMINASAATSSQLYPQQDRMSNFLLGQDPMPSGLQRAMLYPSGSFLMPPQEYLVQNHNVLSDPDAQTTSSISDGYPYFNAQRPSFSSQSQDLAYSFCDAPSPRPESVIDPNLIEIYHPGSPDVYYQGSKTDFHTVFNGGNWQAQMHYSVDDTPYSPIYNSQIIYSSHINDNDRPYAPLQDLESWKNSNNNCNSDYQTRTEFYNSNYPQTRQHSRQTSFRSTQMKREESTSSNDDERKPTRPRYKVPKRPRPKHICHECPKEVQFKNKSDLRKHRETQHTKPYYCFFKPCGKNFGARNEWKRHIITQHLQLATWKCDRPQCADKLEFNRKDLFIKHLERMHKPKSYRDTESFKVKWKEQCISTEQRCIRPRTPPQVCRCGFCGEEFKSGGLAWSSFIDHVGLHYQNGDECAKNILNWKEDHNLTQWCNDHGLVVCTGSSGSNVDGDCSGTCCQSDYSTIKTEDSCSD